MASVEALARRRGEALDRLSAVSGRAAEKFGVEPPSFDVSRRDPELGRIELIERVAGFLERLTADVEVEDAAGGQEGDAGSAADTPPVTGGASKRRARRAAKKAEAKK